MEGKDQPVDFKRVYTNTIVSELIRFSGIIDKFYANNILFIKIGKCSRQEREAVKWLRNHRSCGENDQSKVV